MDNSISRSPRRRPGFTIVELILSMMILGFLVYAWGSYTRSTVATVESVNGRAITSAQRQMLDTRVGEVSRTAPQLGDLQFVGAATLSFRKRQAVTATVCAYTSPTVTVDLTATEAANLAVGDSVLVRVGRGTSDTTDDYWAIARLANATPVAGCSGRPATLSATFTTVIPSNTDIATGATVRFFSTRTYTSTFMAADSGYALIETVNGANPARVFSYYNALNVFTYLDSASNPAAFAATVRLVQATFIPYLFQSRQRVAALREHMEWAISTKDSPSLAGTIIPIAGSTTTQVRCTNPSATNYGDTRNACVFPLVCSAPLTQTQTISCGAGYLAGGTILQQQTKGAYPGCAWSSWSNVSNTCVAIVYGCMDNTAQNYNAAANTSNGTCTYCSAPGPSPSTNTMACPAGNTGLETQSCTTTYACAHTWSPGPTPTTVCGAWSTAPCSCSAPLTQTQVLGCGGGYLAGGSITQVSTKGAPTTCAWGGWVTTSNTCVPIVYGCTNPGAQNYNGSANTDNGSCTYCTPGAPSSGNNTETCNAYFGSGYSGNATQPWTTTYSCANSWSPNPGTPSTSTGGWDTSACVPLCTPNPTTYTPYTDYSGPCNWGYQGFSTASCTTTTTYTCPNPQTAHPSNSCGAWQNQGSGFGSGNCSCIMNDTGYLQVFADPIGGGWYSCDMYNQLTCMATGGIAWTYAGWSCGTTNTPWPGCLAC